ncbi:MAG: lamin tail domain-containing protein [Polyangiales bacterium]
MRFAVWLLASVVAGCGSAGDDRVGTVEQALSSDLVISQVYGAGGNASATYNTDFVEIFNRGSSPASLAGLSIQYASAAGTSWLVTPLPSKSVPAGGYFLVGLASSTTGGALPTADATGSSNMAAANGRVALVKVTTALGCGTSCKSNSDVIDFVGYGTAADHEGTGAAPAPADAAHSIQRKLGGCTETDDNAADFKAPAVTPHNSATPVAPCGPVDDASVAPDTGDDSSASDTDTTSDGSDSTTPPEDSFLPGEDAPAADSSAKKASASDLPSASTCAYPIHNPSQGSFALIGVALGLAFFRRALR